ncbi:MAG: hypothetical protein RIT45_281 [Pseudomonadota bacterium]|jgi:hypothetical protein
MVFGDKQRDPQAAKEPASDTGATEREPTEAREGPGFAKRAIEAGVMRMLQTEEGLRALAGAVVPRELVGKALDGVDTVKGEAVAVIGRELRTFLANLNVGEEMAKILTSVSFEVKMQVRFVPNEDGTLRAQVRSDGGPKVQVGEPGERRRRRDEASGAVAAAPVPDEAAAAAGAESVAAEPAAPAATVGSAPAADDPGRARRKLVKDVAMRFAERTAATARAAAEVAADAAAEVVNRSLDDGDDDDEHDLDSY